MKKIALNNVRILENKKELKGEWIEERKMVKTLNLKKNFKDKWKTHSLKKFFNIRTQKEEKKKLILSKLS